MKIRIKIRLINLIIPLGIILISGVLLKISPEKEKSYLSPIPQTEINDIILKGHLLINDGFSENLEIKQLYQNRAEDYWSDDIMLSEGDTIATSGCLLTSFTMLRNYFDHAEDTPCEVNAILNKSACPFNFPEASEKYNYSYEGYIKCTNIKAYKSAIFWYLSCGTPVIIQLRGKNSVSHFVLAVGCSPEGIIINDTDIYKNYRFLNQYLDDDYIIEKLHILKK